MQCIDEIESSGLTPVVIDFEYTTPRGMAPEPIEVAVQALEVRSGCLQRAGRAEMLMRPPAHAALTPFDVDQTGITPEMLADAPSAEAVLAQLDRRFTVGPYALVAHHAPAEARILANYRDRCPNLARVDLIDTVRLAKDLFPQLGSHRLDEVLFHLQIPTPANRHRAMADVQVTTELFLRMLTDSTWRDLRTLKQLAGIEAA